MNKQKEYHILTREEISEKLKAMEVDGKNVYPSHGFAFIVINKDYNPEEFSQEIEDSEDEINSLDLAIKEIKKPEFDFLFNNTLYSVPYNSDAWKRNYSKKCPLAAKGYLYLSCVNYKDKRNYYSEENVNKILAWGRVNGDIVDF